MTAAPTPACAVAARRGRPCAAHDGPDALTTGHTDGDGRHVLPACTGCRLRPNALLWDFGRHVPAARADCLTPNPVEAARRLRLHCRAYYGWSPS